MIENRFSFSFKLLRHRAVSLRLAAVAVLIVMLLLPASSGLAQPAVPQNTVSSTSTDCLWIGDNYGTPNNVGEMFIVWSGTVTSAKLVGNEFNVGAFNDIYLNDTFIGKSIIDGTATNGPYCAPYSSGTKEWPIPLSLIQQGVNLVRITAALKPDNTPDEWGMTGVHLVLEGQNLVIPQVVDFTFTSSYDDTTQPAALQIPAGYNAGEPTPLLLAIHGWGDDRWASLTDYAEVANSAGWLVASPDMHGERSAYPRPAYDHPLAARASQQDILDTIAWVRAHYNVDPNRIYIAGVSMGAQIALVTAAKNPGLFAAVAADRGPSDLIRWYDESEPWRQLLIAQETGGEPDSVLWFEYQRRSPILFARNLVHTPVRLYQATGDITVLPHHTQDMLDAIRAALPSAPVSLISFAGDHTTPLPGGRAVVVQWLSNYTLGSYPATLDAITDTSTAIWWVQLTQQGAAERWTTLNGALDSSNQVIVHTIDSTGLDLAVDVAGLGLPNTRTAVEDLGVDQATFSSQAVDLVNGRAVLNLNSGAHRVTLYPGQSPAPVATLVLQEGVDGYGGAQDSFLDGWNPAAGYGGAALFRIRSPNVRNGILRFDLSGVPAAALANGLRGAAFSLYVVSHSNNNSAEIAAYPLTRAWQENQTTWERASTGQAWAQGGANGVPADRAGEAVDARFFDDAGVRRGFDVTASVAGWLAAPATNYGWLLRSGDPDVEYGIAAREYTTAAQRPRLLIVYPMTPPTPTPTATPTLTPTPTATPTVPPTATPSPTPTATATPVQGGVRGVAWNDLNTDQIRQDNEPGMAGVTLTLFYNGSAVATRQSAADGSFEFGGLTVDRYYTVVATPPQAYAPTTPVQRTVYVSAGVLIDVLFGLRYDPQTVYLPLLVRNTQ